MAFSENSSTLRITVDPCSINKDTINGFRSSCAEKDKIEAFFDNNLLVVYALDHKLKFGQNEVVNSNISSATTSTEVTK